MRPSAPRFAKAAAAEIVYPKYKSPYGPNYKVQRTIAGWNLNNARHVVFTLGGFGGVAGFFALFFFTDIPRVRKDIISRIPFLSEHYRKEIPASDNPF